jgi:DNA-binding CsgD family transcriptional regulator
VEANAWPLTGRSAELRSIAAALRRTDRPRGLVLAGAAGVGKTRLARETLELASRRGMTTSWAVATQAARTLPLGAFAGLLGDIAGDQTRVVSQAVRALEATSAVVGVDDAHLLDALSGLVLQQLVLRRRVAVVVTVRSGEPAPDVVTALWKDGLLDRVELRALSETETLTLLEEVLGAQVDSETARRMWELTQGNALFLRQIVDSELAADRLRESNGVWSWLGTPAISPKLAEIVAARMGALPESLRDVVDVLALGEPLDTRVLGTLVDPSALEVANERGLVQLDSGPRLLARLAHPLYGEARRGAIGQLRARRLRGEIAEALAQEASADPDLALRRAVLTLDSDLEKHDASLLTDACRTAFRRLDMALAERLARAAIAAGAGFEAEQTLAYTLAWQGRGEDAQAQFVDAFRAARTDDERATMAVTRAGNAFNIVGDAALAESVFVDAEATIHEERARNTIAAMRSMAYAMSGQPARAMELGGALLASGPLADTAVVRAACGLVGGAAVVGRMDDVDRSLVSAGYDAAARTVDGAIQGLFLRSYHLHGLRLAGYLSELDAVERDYNELDSMAAGATRLIGAFMSGYASLAHGRVRTAVRTFREVHSGFARTEFGMLARQTRVHLAYLLAASGDTDGARPVLDGLEVSSHPGMVAYLPELILARAWIAAAGGSVREGASLAASAAAAAAEGGQWAYEVLAWHTAVCFGSRSAGDRLAWLASRVQGPRAPLALEHASALAADDVEGLLAVSAGFEALGDYLAAADAAAQASSLSDSAAVESLVRRLSVECEGARTPALVRAVRPLPLTSRELEIVSLAAEGLSNREIADRLSLSLRTVESHLYRAGAKLGTGNRAEYGALLRGSQ